MGVENIEEYTSNEKKEHSWDYFLISANYVAKPVIAPMNQFRPAIRRIDRSVLGVKYNDLPTNINLIGG